MENRLTAKEMTETLLKLHFENLAYARHHETMRSNVATLLVLVMGGLLSILGALYKTSDAQFHRVTIFVCPVLIAVGLFGMLLNGKLYERARRHSAYAHGYLRELSALFQQAGFRSLWIIQNEARTEHRSRFWFWRWWRLHWGWFAINLLLVGVGVGLLISVLSNWP